MNDSQPEVTNNLIRTHVRLLKLSFGTHVSFVSGEQLLSMLQLQIRYENMQLSPSDHVTRSARLLNVFLNTAVTTGLALFAFFCSHPVALVRT